MLNHIWAVLLFIGILVAGLTGHVSGEGSVIDVSGGLRVGSSGGLTGGNAGSISLSSSPVIDGETLAGTPFELNGALRGAALAGARGASLSLRANEVVVGPVEAWDATLAESAREPNWPGAQLDYGVSADLVERALERDKERE